MNFLHKLKKSLLITHTKLWVLVGVVFFAFCILILNSKVHPSGFKYYQNFEVVRDRHIGGPYESSGSTSRYALTEMIVKFGRIDFDLETAKFASPDVAGTVKFFSLFTPGVSFLAVPFYYIGRLIGYEQFTTFLLNIFFAISNLLLVVLILRHYKVSFLLQIATGLILLFATNMFVYSLHLTQHTIGAFLVLACIYITTLKPTILNNVLLGLLYGVGIIVDIPNAFILLPAVLYYVFKHIEVVPKNEKIILNFKTICLVMILGLIPMTALFGWYNKNLTGSPTVLPQFIGRNTHVGESVRPESRATQEVNPFETTSPFVTRFLLNGLYILIISNERGWVYYMPILFVGVLGMYLAFKDEHMQDKLLVPSSILAMNTLLYAMFGDPWGGWAFGARYMIPGAAAAALFIPLAIRKFRKNILALFFISALVIYSVFINALGATTTTEVPPKQEAEQLLTYIPYTYEYNYQLIQQNKSYSLLNTQLMTNVPGYTLWLLQSVLLSLAILIPIYIYSGRELIRSFKKS